MTPDDVRKIFQEMFDKNYRDGNPQIPPHQHNGVDNLRINSSDLIGSLGGSPGGDDTEVQFNDGGSFGGDTGLKYDKTTKVLTVDNISGTADVNASNSLIISTPYNAPFFSNDVEILTSGGSDDSAFSGNLNIKTGSMAGQFTTSGDINVVSGDSGVSSRSGHVMIKSGESVDSGNSGSITIQGGGNNTGDNGNAAPVNILGGDVLVGTGGKIAGWVVQTGGGSGIGTGNRSGGGILLRARIGHGTGKDGFISLTNATGSNGVGSVNIFINAGGDITSPLNNDSGPAITGKGVIFIADANTIPSSDPTGGGILYVDAGALMYYGSGGTITTIAPA